MVTVCALSVVRTSTVHSVQRNLIEPESLHLFPETVHVCVFLTKGEKILTRRVCPSVRNTLHSTKPFAEQYSSRFTDLFVQRELGNIGLAEGWVRTSACTVRICVPICLKFGVVPNIHAVRLGHTAFLENRRNESRGSLTYVIPC